VVDVICDVQRKQPVVGTVLEETGDGHCRMREPVHKQSFQQPFSIVQRPAASRNTATAFMSRVVQTIRDMEPTAGQGLTDYKQQEFKDY
jgi:hypothetical protein